MKNISLFLVVFLSTSAMAKSVNNYSYCEDLPINKSIKVNIPNSRSKITEQKYTIVRKSEKVYDIIINPHFSKTWNCEDCMDASDGKLNEHYKGIISQCFQKFNSRLVDEYDRQLNLHIYDKKTHQQLSSAPPVIEIKIKNSDSRSDSRSYANDVDCGTYIHESFHLLGLVDEYQEEWMGYNHNLLSAMFKPFVDVDDNILPAFDCRAVTPGASIMKDHNEFIWHSYNKLYSAQINAIIYPNCAEKNKKYFICASFAYSTSSKNNGILPNVFDCAKKVPDYCRNGDWLKVELNDDSSDAATKEKNINNPEEQSTQE